MPAEFDQDAFDTTAKTLLESSNTLQKQLQTMRLGGDFQPFHALVPTFGLGATATPQTTIQEFISPVDAVVVLTGIIPTTQAQTTVVLQDGDDPGTQVTLALAANTAPIPLWDLPFLRGIKIISATGPAVVYGRIRR